MSNGRASKRNGYRYQLDQQPSPIELEPTYTDDEISELNRQMTNPLGIPPSELMRQNFDPAAQIFTGRQSTQAWPGPKPDPRPLSPMPSGPLPPPFGPPVGPDPRQASVQPPSPPMPPGPRHHIGPQNWLDTFDSAYYPRLASVRPPVPPVTPVPPPPPQQAPWQPSLVQSPVPPQPDPRGWRPSVLQQTKAKGGHKKRQEARSPESGYGGSTLYGSMVGPR